jgi:hypothetical protein
MTDAIERAENEARRDRITLQASKLGQAAVWMERNAAALARIGVGDISRVLLGDFDERHLTFYVYGDKPSQTQTFEAVRQLLGGEWEEERSGEHRHMTQEIVDDFAIEFFGSGFYEAPEGAEGE